MIESSSPASGGAMLPDYPRLTWLIKGSELRPPVATFHLKPNGMNQINSFCALVESAKALFSEIHIELSPFVLLYWSSCSTFRKLGSAISRSAARNAVKTSRRRLARCRIPGLPHSVHFAARRGTIFPLRSFEGSSRTDLVLSPCDQWCTDG